MATDPRLSRWATSWVNTIRAATPNRDSAVSNTERSRFWASSMMTNVSDSDHRDVGEGQHLDEVAGHHLVDDLGSDDRLEGIAHRQRHGDIFSSALPGRYPSSWPPTA